MQETVPITLNLDRHRLMSDLKADFPHYRVSSKLWGWVAIDTCVDVTVRFKVEPTGVKLYARRRWLPALLSDGSLMSIYGDMELEREIKADHAKFADWLRRRYG